MGRYDTAGRSGCAHVSMHTKFPAIATNEPFMSASIIKYASIYRHTDTS